MGGRLDAGPRVDGSKCVRARVCNCLREIPQPHSQVTQLVLRKGHKVQDTRALSSQESRASFESF